MKYKRGDVVWIDDFSGSTVDCVQSQNRPAVIIQNDTGNNYSWSTIVVYGTTSIKKEAQPTHVVLSGGGLKQPTLFMGEQIDTVPMYSIKSRLGKLTDKQMEKIDKIVQESLDIDPIKRQTQYELEVYETMKKHLKGNDLVLYIQTTIIRLSGAFSSTSYAKNECLVNFFKEELDKHINKGGIV